jgi:pSer/pThr/pTyr-binding forkhead associated (FHA) protein
VIVRRGPAAGTKFTMDGDVVTVGRLGSLNGTYVNRARVDSSVLSSGDELQIGKFRLLFLARES